MKGSDSMLLNRLYHLKPNHGLKKGDTLDFSKDTGFTNPKDWEEQMEALARDHKKVRWLKYNRIIGTYNQIAYTELNHMRKHIASTSSDIIGLIPSARWLFDNFQMMYREIKKVKTTGTSYKTLPVLRTGEYKGYPRIYVIARKMVDFTGGYLNEETITLMIKAYQNSIPLTDKELWALPEMLGLCILGSIIHVSEEIIDIIDIKTKADDFVKRKIAVNEDYLDIAPLMVKLSGNCHDNISFHCHTIYLLKNMAVKEEAIQRYIEYHCTSETKLMSSSEIFKEEGRIESLLESHIRTLIVSLREINQLDEQSLFESLSLLENTLLKDPDGTYPGMDIDSRSLYRSIIVRLAQKYNKDEHKVGEMCLELAKEGREDIPNPNHVGSYLVGKAYPVLKARIRNRTYTKPLRHKHNASGAVYTILMILILVIAYSLVYMELRDGGVKQTGYIVLFFILIAPLLIGIALEITNAISTRTIKVKKIPAMDYLKGVPDEARTFVVMPVILSTKQQGVTYFNRLLKYYLANPQKNIYYALLADYSDAPERIMATDADIEQALVEKMNELNELHPDEFPRFSLFIRYRKWNEAENCFMCWERKRGKLEEFNALLMGRPMQETSFSTVLCPKELLPTFKYVITLDADSNLIRDNASKMVGLIDHPLNRAIVDLAKKKITDGYAIVQPSVRNHIIERNASRFPKLFGGQTGIANYATVTSDVYQDVFHRGTYIGKGIYNVAVFHQLLDGKIPENSVLSHDLLESCYVRTAFDSTVNIMDTFPTSILSYMNREHRWIRGDWQLVPWLFHGRGVDILSRWKIAENLRRSLVPASKIVLVIINLIFIPGTYYLWIPIIFFSELFGLLNLLVGVISFKIRRPRLALVRRSFYKEIFEHFQRGIMELILLPYKAHNAYDAIFRTLYRVCISKKKLLRWKASEHVEKSLGNSLRDYFRHMWTSLIPAGILILILIVRDSDAMEYVVYGFVALLWAFSYVFAYLISQPYEEEQAEAIKDEDHTILDAARRTWRFFKDFSTRENHFMCPDNYQITYKEKVTSKTSPTNLGLQFLAILSARDFGFETLTSTIRLTDQLLRTVVELPKWKGHLFNWYNTRTIEVLNPQYISTVDSGNFFGAMIAFKNGLLEQKYSAIFLEETIADIENKLRLTKTEIVLCDGYTTIGSFAEDLERVRMELNLKERQPWEDEYEILEVLTCIEAIEKEVVEFDLASYDILEYPTLELVAKTGNECANRIIRQIDQMAKTIDNLLNAADFQFLYNKKRMLFHIGYHVNSQVLDAGCYDLMASESLLTSFLAIARGEVPTKHWYRMGRPQTLVDGLPAFVSWSGTMFEYLMPNLVLRDFEDSVFQETAKAAVIQQMKFGKKKNIPWGISESQYYGFDLDSNYQYRAFGIPGLRLQPSMTKSLVVSPYSTMLALDYAKNDAIANLRRLKSLGAYGKYGFYEAVDFNVPDPNTFQNYCIVKSFMAHHQGMSLVAMNNFVHNGIMRSRFHDEPMVKATQILLEEKRQSFFISISKKGYAVTLDKIDISPVAASAARYVAGVTPQVPVVNHMSNNSYSVMVTSDGDGFSNYKGTMINRWRSDLYANTGSYIYIKDVSENRVWSTTYHPTKAEPDKYTAVFSPHMAEFKRSDRDVSTHTEVTISPNHNLEIRKVKLINHSKSKKQIELTSYMEVVADKFMAELSHPAFNKLFMESEFLPEQSILLARRRSSKADGNPYVMHMVKTEAALDKHIEFENDRLNFIGRNRTLQNPDAIYENIALSNSTSFSNDPIMSLRICITLKAEEIVYVTFITGVCDSKEQAIQISDELGITYRIDDIFEKFRQQSDMELKYLNITPQQVNAFQDIISPVYYPNVYFRGPDENIRRNWKNQSFLWRFGVSGDAPILLLRVSSVEEAGIIRDVLKAYEYLRINQVKVDLIILSEAKYGYMQELTDLLYDMIGSLKIYDEDKDRPSLFILHSYQMIPAEIDLLFTVARVVFSSKTGIYFRNIKETIKETKFK